MNKTYSDVKYKHYTWVNGNVTVTENFSGFADILAGKVDELATIVQKHALNISAVAAQNAPVDTGALKGTLASGAKEIEKLKWAIEDGVEYGIYQELGEKANKPHFLGGATEREAEPFFEDIREALKKQ